MVLGKSLNLGQFLLQPFYFPGDYALVALLSFLVSRRRTPNFRLIIITGGTGVICSVKVSAKLRSDKVERRVETAASSSSPSSASTLTCAIGGACTNGLACTHSSNKSVDRREVPVSRCSTTVEPSPRRSQSSGRTAPFGDEGDASSTIRAYSPRGNDSRSGIFVVGAPGSRDRRLSKDWRGTFQGNSSTGLMFSTFFPLKRSTEWRLSPSSMIP